MFKMMLFFILVLFGFSFHLSQGSSENEGNWISNIRRSILTGYDRTARPVKDHSRNTSVSFGISLNDINLDEKTQRMRVVSYWMVMWTDEYLTWDPKLFGGIQMIHLDREEAWLPDIALYNSASDTNISPTSKIPLICYSSGMMFWVPPFVAEVPCQMDLSRWPSDVQTCTLHFGSWAHHSEQIDFKPTGENHSISLEHYEENKKWRLINYTSKVEAIKNEGGDFHYVSLLFTVQRRAASHVKFITNSTIGVILAILSSYLLPLRYHISRLLLHLFSMVILIICNSILFLSLPMTGGTVPLIVKYYSGTIVLTSLSLILNVLIATAISSSFVLQESMKKTLIEAFSFQTVPVPEFESREMDYTTLDEEWVDESNSKQGSGHPADDSRKNKKTRRILRVLNALFFVIFAFAYVIDYSILRGAIG